MKVLIVSGGDAPSKSLLEEYKDWYVIAADRGAEALLKAGIYPNLLIGDLDSVETSFTKDLKDRQVPIKTWPKEKDETDTHLCLLEAIRLKADLVHIVGCFGRRFDHTMGHLALLELARDYKIPCYLVDDQNKVSMITKGKYEIKKDGYTYLSLVPITEEITLSLYNMKYPLERESLYRKKSQGISNEILGESGTIKLYKGKSYLILSKDK